MFIKLNDGKVYQTILVKFGDDGYISFTSDNISFTIPVEAVVCISSIYTASIVL